MGDVRFDAVLERVRSARDSAAAIRSLTDEEVIHALAAASKQLDPYYANVLATEAANRRLRAAAFDERLARQNEALVRLAKEIGLIALDQDAALRAITEVAARTLDVARASVWLFSDDESEILCVDLYEAEVARHSTGARLTAAEYPSYFRAMEEAHVIPAHDARTDPRTSEFRDSYLDPLGIGAMLDAPVRLQGRLAGVVCHEHVGGARIWTVDEQQFAAWIAAHVELSLESGRRARLERDLRAAENVGAAIAQATDLADIGVAVAVGEFPNLRLVYANETAARMSGRTREELISGEPMDMVAPEERARVAEAIANALRMGGKATMLRILALLKDGSSVPAEIGIAKATFQGADAVVAFSRDVSAQAQAEESLSSLVRTRTNELEAANRELAAFVDSVAHDLRAPIRRVKQLSEVLAEEYADTLDTEGRGILDALVAESRRTSDLVRDMRALSSAAASEIHLDDIDLTQLAREVAEELRAGEPSREAEIVVEQGMRAWADRGLMRVVLVNLLGNAWKFTSRVAHPRIEVGSTLSDEGEVVYHVRDNGVGFDPSQAERMFTPFTRLHAERDYEGTGIGLATVQRIVHRHGGRVWAVGAPGRGATISFTLSALNTSEAGSPAPARTLERSG